MSLSPKSSLKPASNLEKKILRGAFTPHKNDLRTKGDSLDSPESSPSQTFSEFSVSKELSPHISAIQQMQHFWDAIREEESVLSSCVDRSLDLQQYIFSANEGDVLELPPVYIVVENLLIDSSLVLKGAPGTVLEVRNGSIFLKNRRKAQLTVVFTELNIVYRLTEEYLSVNDGPSALFILEDNGTSLEVRDCSVKSQSNLLKHSIEDTCFFLNGAGCSKNYTEEHKDFNGALQIRSCQITNFYEAVRAGVNSSLYIEKSFIDNAKGNGVSVVNPREVIVLQSYFRRCRASGLEIRIVKQPKHLSSRDSIISTSTGTSEKQLRTISVSQSELRSNGGYGIHIWSEHTTSYPLSIHIRDNLLSNNKQAGVSIKHLEVKELVIAGNDMKGNSKSGCWIQKVNKAEGPIFISDCTFSESSAGYGLYLYGVSAAITRSECSRNSLGGVAVVGTKRVDLQNISIQQCVIGNNGENGITFLQIMNGDLQLHRVKIAQNKQNGIYGCFKLKTRALAAQLNIKECSILENKGYGITAYRVPFRITDTELTNNGKGDFNIDHFTKKQGKLVLKDPASPRKDSCKEACNLL